MRVSSGRQIIITRGAHAAVHVPTRVLSSRRQACCARQNTQQRKHSTGTRTRPARRAAGRGCPRCGLGPGGGGHPLTRAHARTHARTRAHTRPRQRGTWTKAALSATVTAFWNRSSEYGSGNAAAQYLFSTTIATDDAVKSGNHTAPCSAAIPAALAPDFKPQRSLAAKNGRTKTGQLRETRSLEVRARGRTARLPRKGNASTSERHPAIQHTRNGTPAHPQQQATSAPLREGAGQAAGGLAFAAPRHALCVVCSV